MIGTPAYVAPERIDGETATPASDVYATGVVLYEAVTGRKPFVAGTSIALVEQIRAGRAPALGKLAPQVDPTLEQVIERAMAPDPPGRFASAADMRRALQEVPQPRRSARPGEETEPRARRRLRHLLASAYRTRAQNVGR
jgi:serine/threonine-protein kinase